MSRLDVRPGAGACAPSRFLRTVWRIPPGQLAARTRFLALDRLYRLAPERALAACRREAEACSCADPLPAVPADLAAPEGGPTIERRAAALAAGRFFLAGREARYGQDIRWKDPEASPLWLFQLHYLASVLDLALTGRAACAREILGSWRRHFEERWDPVAWHPYPASLRLTNLLLAAGHLGSFDALGQGTATLAACHAAFVLRHLERDLGGNHLLENAVALVLAGRFLRGPLAERCDRAGRRVLEEELPRQVLRDGCHFELSPMYHSIVLHRGLLTIGVLGPTDELVRRVLQPAAVHMARFLREILCPDGDIPLLGDSVRGFAPPPERLLSLAASLAGYRDEALPLGVRRFAESGICVFRGRRLWAVFDAGPVCPDSLPGHGQADSLTVEVWCNGACVVADPGVHEYTGPERAWGRSSRAHSTLTVDDADTSEVYGSFRVGGRARVEILPAAEDTVAARLQPYGARATLERQVRLADGDEASLEIEDGARAPEGAVVRARLHLHPAVKVLRLESTPSPQALLEAPCGRLRVRSLGPLSIEDGRVSRELGVVEPTRILVQELIATRGSGEAERRGVFRLSVEGNP